MIYNAIKNWLARTDIADAAPVDPDEELRNQIAQRNKDYPVDPRIDELIEYLLENSDRVIAHYRNEYWLYLAIDGNLYRFWIENKFYAYLAIGDLVAANEKGHIVITPLWYHAFPEISNAFKFLKQFDIPSEDLYKPDKGPDTFIQPPKYQTTN